MLDPLELDAALDLWGCMWEPEERESFETALVRALNDSHPHRTRLIAFAACQVIATPRLIAATERVIASQVFSPKELVFIERQTLPRRSLSDAAARMRGNVLGVELLLMRAASGSGDAPAEQLLDYVDVRDLVAVARTTLDARLYGEVERCLARRGKYQQGRAANLLHFRVRRGEQGSQSPEIGGWRSSG